jgi:hypothetical protein
MQKAFVLDKNKQPLMPCHLARARELLRKKKAAVSFLASVRKLKVFRVSQLVNAKHLYSPCFYNYSISSAMILSFLCKY